MAMSPLERLRRDRGLDQTELAEKARVSQSTISRAENGESLTLAAALRIAEVLGAPVEAVFPAETYGVRRRGEASAIDDISTADTIPPPAEVA